jgi:hypothetical protein
VWSSLYSCEKIKGKLVVSVIDVELRAGKAVDFLNIY